MARFVMPNEQVVNADASGVGSGWKLNFYDSGTTTRKDTFSDNALTTANANPVVADSAGRFGDIWLEAGSYKVVLTDENDVEQWTADPVESSVEQIGVISKSANYTVTVGDEGKLILVDASSAAVTITLPAAGTAGDGFKIAIKLDDGDSSGNGVTIDANGAEVIDGSATQAFTEAGRAMVLRCDGTEWRIEADFFGLQVGTGLSLSGNTVSVTGLLSDIAGLTVAQGDVLYIDSNGDVVNLGAGTDGQFLQTQGAGANPQWAYATVIGTVEDLTNGGSDDLTAVNRDLSAHPSITRIDIVLDSASLSGTDNYLFQIGPSGGVESSGYTSSSQVANSTGNSSTSGFIIQSAGAAKPISGVLTLQLVDSGSNIWAASGTFYYDSNAIVVVGGRKALAGALTQYTLTRDGTDTFDGGNMNEIVTF